MATATALMNAIESKISKGPGSRLVKRSRSVKLAALAAAFADGPLHRALVTAEMRKTRDYDPVPDSVRDARAVINLILGLTKTPCQRMKFLDLETPFRTHKSPVTGCLKHYTPGMQTGVFLLEVACEHAGLAWIEEGCLDASGLDSLVTVLRYAHGIVQSALIGEVRDPDAIFRRLSRATGGLDFRPGNWGEAWGRQLVEEATAAVG